jgi:two-component system cell cycle sensor histidine kinase/response regulator CckA
VVLLVDDDEAVRRVTARFLALLGYTVVEAGNAAQALAAAEGPVDVVLSDIVLPGIRGPALLEQLRSRRPSLRTVLMTGYAREALHLEELPQGTGLLTKPFTLDELRACLGGTGDHTEHERVPS